MVELRVCSFCGAEIEPGTGKMYVKKDGTVYLFCSNKCSKNQIEMSRVPRRTTWTRAYTAAKGVRMKISTTPVEVAPVAEVAKETKGDKRRAVKAKKIAAAEAKPAPAPEASTEAQKAEQK